MSKELVLFCQSDGKWAVYDNTYDITIHCESKQEQDETLADVMLSASVLFGCEFEDNDSRNLCEEVSDEIADIAGEKLDRWRNRLLARPLAKTIEVKEDKKDG